MQRVNDSSSTTSRLVYIFPLFTIRFHGIPFVRPRRQASWLVFLHDLPRKGDQVWKPIKIVKCWGGSSLDTAIFTTNKHVNSLLSTTHSKDILHMRVNVLCAHAHACDMRDMPSHKPSPPQRQEHRPVLLPFFGLWVYSELGTLTHRFLCLHRYKNKFRIQTWI